jgi:hypothetical protein
MVNLYDGSKIDYIINSHKEKGLQHQIITKTANPVIIYFTSNKEKRFHTFLQRFLKLPYVKVLDHNTETDYSFHIRIPSTPSKSNKGQFWKDTEPTEYNIRFIFLPRHIYPFRILLENSTPNFIKFLQRSAHTKNTVLTKDGFLRDGSPIIQNIYTTKDIFRFLGIDYIPENERTHRRTQKHDIWYRGKYAESCNQTCSQVNKKCVSNKIKGLRSTKKIQQIAVKTGTTCKKYSKTANRGPFVEDYGGKGCWVSSIPANDKINHCSTKSDNWNTNVCACK